MKRDIMDLFGALLLTFQAGGNLLHLPWTACLVAEQIRTGWGYGTNMEMMVLAPWMLELLCVPVLAAAVVYLILSIWHRGSRGILIADLSLLGLLILQFGVTNLCVWF